MELSVEEALDEAGEARLEVSLRSARDPGTDEEAARSAARAGKDWLASLPGPGAPLEEVRARHGGCWLEAGHVVTAGASRGTGFRRSYEIVLSAIASLARDGDWQVSKRTGAHSLRGIVPPR